MLGNDDAIDVLKLYLAVRANGGFDEVSKKKLWDSVAEESGIISCTGSTAKFVYKKYLDTLETRLENIGKEMKSVMKEAKATKDKASTSGLMHAELPCEDMNALISNKKDGGEHSEPSHLNSGNRLNS